MTAANRTQRLGAYAVVIHDGSMLLTRISAHGFPVGHWTLPGGGVDHGESPHLAVRRELYEETGLEAISARLVDVHDTHVVDVGRNDVYEDYHGVHLLYAVDVDATAVPHVVDIGGTTDDARWVSLAQIASGDLAVLSMVTHVMATLDHFGGGA